MRVAGIVSAIVILSAALALVLWIGGQGGAGAKVAGPVTPEGKNAEGEFVANPFQAATSGPQPKLEASETEFDFGIMKFPLVDGDDPDDKPDGGSHTFVIKNVGDGVLKLAKGPSTCQCTMSEIAADIVEVPPGGSTNVTVTWEPGMIADPFEKGASVWTNDPALFAAGSQSQDGKIMLTVRGRVLNALELEPSLVSLGTIAEKEPTKFEAQVISLSDPDLQITVKETSSEFITAEITPLEPEKLTERSALSGWYVRGTIIPKVPIGSIRESVTLATNDKQRPELKLEIEATRQGPVSIAGRFWNNAYTMVDFRQFEAAKGIETTLSLYASRQDPPIELKQVELRPAGLVVTAERDSAYADPDRDRFLIHVQVPPGRAPERLVSKDAGLVRYETNIPDVPSIKFHIVYESH